MGYCGDGTMSWIALSALKLHKSSINYICCKMHIGYAHFLIWQQFVRAVQHVQLALYQWIIEQLPSQNQRWPDKKYSTGSLTFITALHWLSWQPHLQIILMISAGIHSKAKYQGGASIRCSRFRVRWEKQDKRQTVEDIQRLKITD